MMGSLPLLLLLLLLAGAGFGGGVRLGGGGYEDWRLGTATYVKEFQPHPLNDGTRLLRFLATVIVVASSGKPAVSVSQLVLPHPFLTAGLSPFLRVGGECFPIFS